MYKFSWLSLPLVLSRMRLVDGLIATHIGLRYHIGSDGNGLAQGGDAICCNYLDFLYDYFKWIQMVNPVCVLVIYLRDQTPQQARKWILMRMSLEKETITLQNELHQACWTNCNILQSPNVYARPAARHHVQQEDTKTRSWQTDMADCSILKSIYMVCTFTWSSRTLAKLRQLFDVNFYLLSIPAISWHVQTLWSYTKPAFNFLIF